MGSCPDLPGAPGGGSAPASGALVFARAARALGVEARRLGLTVPGFRSPPGLSQSDRTIRRARWGAVVSVRLRGRPFEAVLADMVEGVVVANGLERDAARRARVVLLQAVLQEVGGPSAAPRSAEAA